MAKRKDYYFRQPVTESELDAGFDGLEQADFSMIVDHGLFGITEGLAVSEKSGTPDLSVDVSGPGTAYSKQGERISISSTQNVDLSVDDGSVSTVVAGGSNEKTISVFLTFDRNLSDPRLDGNSATVFFDRDESFQFSIIQGAEAPIGTSIPPALDPNKILLADVVRVFGQTQLLNADVDISRREWLIGNQTATPNTLEKGTVPEAITQLLGIVNTNETSLNAILNAAIKDAVNAFTENNTFEKSLTLGKATTDAELALARILQTSLPDFAYGAGGIRTLFLTFGNPDTDAKTRVYLRNRRSQENEVSDDSRLGIEVIYNAVWDPATSAWSSDDTGEHSMIRLFGFSGSATGGDSRIHIREPGAGTWDDSISSSGWDSSRGQHQQFTSVFGPNFSMYGEDPRISLEAQRALGEGPTPSEHTLYAGNIPKAWASFEVNNGVVQNFRGFNCNTPSDPGTATSVIGVFYKTVMGDGDYAVICGVDQTSGKVRGLVGASKVTGSISFHNFDYEVGTLENFPAGTTVKYQFAVFAQQPPTSAPV